ncbi:hypothetical protein DYB35_002189 [Aphanomyces astaci]|uniref:Methyltransferase type 11 domain-containing protein n=1 Tax=Aphanomyces astaci TaxID=112090 RepID=A0A3R6WWD9_APHAT|nr:hypothetical protein DYB35_002189 [Aphanomyces astaci]
MPYNRPPPERRSRQPDRFYSVDQANVYHSEANSTIQKDLTEMALSLLPPHVVSSPMLDMGCGSGLSTQHLPPHSVGVDVSLSMLQLARSSNSLTPSSYVCGAAFSLPFRSHTFDHVISISMLQWLSPDQLTQCFMEIARVLTPRGSAVLQVYPIDLDHANEMLAAAAKATNSSPVLVADFPHPNSAVKWFLCVDACASPLSSAFGHDKCPLARRLDGTCAYRYRHRRGLEYGRLLHEHVQYAWHAYRKVKRDMQWHGRESHESGAAKAAPTRHHKERRVFPNEARLVHRLLEELPTTNDTGLTLDDLKANAKTVAEIMHATFESLE